MSLTQFLVWSSISDIQKEQWLASKPFNYDENGQIVSSIFF